jgi:LPXTG-site transpeptidase (sortase) family protein
MVSALAPIGLGCCLLLTAGFEYEVYSRVAGPDKRLLPAPFPSARVEPGELVARLSVPRLKLDAPVFEGVEAATLARGAGHVPGTPLPVTRGSNGAAVAALRLNDLVRLTTNRGPRLYRVTERRVLEPMDFRPGPGPSSRVTLLAPFPPDPFGPAPWRVAVALERLDG